MFAGEAVAVHMDLQFADDGNSPIEKLQQDEDRMVKLLVGFARNHREGLSDEQLQKLSDALLKLRDHRLFVLGAVRVNSVLVIIYCETVAATRDLAQLLDSGRLQAMFQDVFSCLTARTLTVAARLHDTTHYQACLQLLTAAGQFTNTHSPTTSLDSEVLRFQRSFCIYPAQGR
jgi:hypothetical protein